MIISRPDIDPEGLYTMTQAAEVLHVDRHTVARYAKGGRIRFHERKAGGRKVTTGREIMRCWGAMHK